MTGKRKSAGAVGRAGRSEADLGQKEAKLEQTQAELEEASEAQLRHMHGGKDAKAAGQQKAKIHSNSATPRGVGRKPTVSFARF
jgi:hypothetical protein